MCMLLAKVTVTNIVVTTFRPPTPLIFIKVECSTKDAIQNDLQTSQEQILQVPQAKAKRKRQ